MVTNSKCELCQTDSLRTSNRECCKLRELAKAPRHQQLEVSQSMTKGERETIRPLLIEEKARLKRRAWRDAK